MKFYIGSSLHNAELVNDYSRILEKNGWEHTYNWTKNINGNITAEDLVRYAEAERQGIAEADVVIILLPAGRGSHIELGMAIALQKKIFLCSATQEEFILEHTVSFYELPGIVKLVGTVGENVERIWQWHNDNLLQHLTDRRVTKGKKDAG